MQSTSVTSKESTGFFSSDAWALVLQESFGVVTHKLVLSPSSTYCLHIFKKGPFKIGYLAFPASVPGVDVNTVIEQVAASGIDTHLLRCMSSDVSGLSEAAQVVAELPQTILFNLDDYDPYKNKKLRRDLKRANKFDTIVISEPDIKQAIDIYRMYEETLRLRHGNVRYNQTYFSALLELAGIDDNVRIFTAYVDSVLVGFVVLVIDGDEAHYLHGAYDRSFNKMGISDLLLEKAILFSQKKGAMTFSLGASPLDQPQLIKYKEKWGAITLPQYTIEYRMNAFWTTCFYISSFCLSLMTNIKRRILSL